MSIQTTQVCKLCSKHPGLFHADPYLNALCAGCQRQQAAIFASAALPRCAETGKPVVPEVATRTLRQDFLLDILQALKIGTQLAKEAQNNAAFCNTLQGGTRASRAVLQSATSDWEILVKMEDHLCKALAPQPAETEEVPHDGQ